MTSCDFNVTVFALSRIMTALCGTRSMTSYYVFLTVTDSSRSWSHFAGQAADIMLRILDCFRLSSDQGNLCNPSIMTSYCVTLTVASETRATSASYNSMAWCDAIYLLQKRQGPVPPLQSSSAWRNLTSLLQWQARQGPDLLSRTTAT